MFSYSKISLLSLLLLSSCLHATIHLPQSITLDEVRKAKKQVAWDIHNVLAEKDGSAKAGAIVKNLPSIIWSKIIGSKAWKEIDKLPKDKDLSGEAYVRIFTKYGNKSLARMAEDAANAYKPRKGMEQIVRQINDAGIQQRLASNIGPNCLTKLDKKFKKKYKCTLFDFMQQGLVVDYSSYGPYYKSNQPSSREHLSKDGKPYNQFFKKL